ncbi:DNA-binding transcriptional regulator, AcrR family [Paramicrobacterium humi]|uniref:DNA-binding transcriptional regulator, AcrR family n=1 Tax=Paramicrobacterium humi TaxID=640635 RepID=A0A1H4NG46_9MICO|nr:TetR/AcrR family transcriptional regulator [Microbacterium humi]SEB94156.1 DNA-binding transcriptional regulator, AcrR family [Microbacterium humi]
MTEPIAHRGHLAAGKRRGSSARAVAAARSDAASSAITRSDAASGDAVLDARTRILDAAERLFALRGFDATATSLIAKTAAVPKGLLFYYFPAKVDILSTLLGERLGGGGIEPGPLVVPGNPVLALLNVSDTLFKAQAESDVLRVIVWREEQTHPEVRSALSRYRHALHDTIEQVLAGSLASPVASRALRAAATAWGAIVTARPLEGEPSGALHAAENLRSVAELICSGLREAAA